MKKYGVYLDENNILHFNCYSNNIKLTSRGKEAIIKMQELFKNDIYNIEEINDEDIYIDFKNSILKIINAEKVLNKDEYSFAKNKIKKYLLHPDEAKNKIEMKKKYKRNRFLAGILAAGVMASTLVLSAATKSDKKDASNTSPSIKITYVDQNFQTKPSLKNTTIVHNNKEMEVVFEKETTVTTTQTTTQTTVETKLTSKTTVLDYEDRTDTGKLQYVLDNYYEPIQKYSKMYGLDPRLVAAIATQESGEHIVDDELPAVGLMQIERSVWEPTEDKPNPSFTAYNFNICDYEKICVDVNELANLDYNVKIGCAMLQESLEKFNYNICAGIQGYNMGMYNLIGNVFPEAGLSLEEVSTNRNETSWMDYRSYAKGGDPEYVEHVVSYLGEDSEITLETPEGETISQSITNNSKGITR